MYTDIQDAVHSNVAFDQRLPVLLMVSMVKQWLVLLAHKEKVHHLNRLVGLAFLF